MHSYNNIFENSIITFNKYIENSGSLEDLFNDFYMRHDIFGYIHNWDCSPDLEAIEIANRINKDLYKKYIEYNDNKKLVGYANKTAVLYNQLDSRHIMMSIILFNYLNSNNIYIENIVEIGGGFGNWLRLNNKIQQFSKWYIIDLPHIGMLQKWYLNKHDINPDKYQIVSAYDYGDISKCDLVIGTHSLSEFDWGIFQDYFNKIIIKSKYFFYCYHKYLPSIDLINKKLELISSKFHILTSFTSENGLVENTFFKLNE
jgi:hypothetical protein